MARRQIPGDEREARDGAELAGAGSAAAESQIRNEELFRMAAFRIRETANRIATLANSARDRATCDVCERLLRRSCCERRCSNRSASLVCRGPQRCNAQRAARRTRPKGATAWTSAS